MGKKTKRPTIAEMSDPLCGACGHYKRDHRVGGCRTCRARAKKCIRFTPKGGAE